MHNTQYLETSIEFIQMRSKLGIFVITILICSENWHLYLWNIKINFEIMIISSQTQGPIYRYGVSGQKYFWGPFSSQSKGLWLVDWLEYSCKLVSWVRCNDFMLTKQWTKNIECTVGIVYVFNLSYNLKTK